MSHFYFIYPYYITNNKENSNTKMLFISNAPVQVQIQEDRRVIILMHNKIMFSHLDFIEEYLTIPLITPYPKKMYYEPSVMQAMVVSQSTLEVYYCDWKTQIKLIRVIILNNQTVESIYYQKQTGWHVFGSLMQYEPTRINFHRASDIKNNRILSKCHINNNMYVLSETKLEKSNEGQALRQMAWKDRMMVLRNCNFKIEMSGTCTLDRRRDILCINQTYALILSRDQVLATIIQPTIVYFQNNLLISHVEQGKLTTVQKYENNQFVQIGTINRPDGDIYGAFLYQDDLMMLMYEDRQLRLNSLPLVDQVQNQPVQASKKGSRKRKLFQSISRILQQSREEGSQLIPYTEKAHDEYKPQNIKENAQPDFSPTNRPIVRDITPIEDQIRDTSLNQGNSQVLSRSGLGQPHHVQPQQFTDHNLSGLDGSAQGQVSFQINDAKTHKRKVQSKYSSQFKSHSYKHSKNKKTVDNFRSDSLKNRRNSNEQKIQSMPDGKNSQISNNSSTSKKYQSKRSIKNQKGSKNFDAHNTSGLSNHSQNEHAQTPAFGFETMGDKWASFDRHWNDAAKDEINEQVEQDIEQSLCIEDAQKSLLKFVPEQLPLKVEKFKPEGGMLTAQIYNKIQKSSYCSLITKAIEQDPDRLEQFMQLFLPNVLEEAEAPLFFQKNIRTFNPQFTQDKIRKLFKSIINNAQFKQKMTSAVQLFKLSQVPRQMLCFPQDFLKVIGILYKDIYIEDLLKPSQTTIDYLLQSYFSIRNFTQQIITIQDQQIDISHPRNMLNVLLYLNQYLKLKIEIIIKVYCSKLLAEDHIDILRKITLKQNIFQICEVPRSVLDEVVIQRFNQLLSQSVQNAEYLWSVIEFLSPGVSDEYRIKLAIINQLNKCNITFDFNMLNKIKNPNTDIFTFLQKIINQNSCRNLINLKIQSIYRSLYWLQEGEKLLYVTNQYVQLAKSLAEKYCEKRLFSYALNLLDTVSSKVKTSFVAKLFMTYLSGKFMNRFSDSLNFVLERLSFMFSEICSNPEVDPATFPNDKIKLPQFSKCFSCSWTKFLSIFQKNLQGPIELKILTFCQVNIVNQIYLMSDENMKRKFQNFLSEIEGNMIIELDDINENDDSINPKGVTSIRFQYTPKNEMQSQIATSTINREDVLLHDDHESRKKIVYKSMTLIDHYNQINCEKLARRNSDEKNRMDRDANGNDDLMRIKLLVGRNQIIEELCEIYENKTQQLFLQSLHLVDLEKLQLYHLDIFKSIVNKQVEYPLSRVLPFQIFLTAEPNQAFETAKPKIKTEITIRNFWVIYAIIQLMFKMGNQICKLFIQKCVLYFRSDDFYEAISSMMEVTKPRIDKIFVTRMQQSAKDYKLIRIQKLLKQYQTLNSFA